MYVCGEISLLDGLIWMCFFISIHIATLWFWGVDYDLHVDSQWMHTEVHKGFWISMHNKLSFQLVQKTSWKIILSHRYYTCIALFPGIWFCDLLYYFWFPNNLVVEVVSRCNCQEKDPMRENPLPSLDLGFQGYWLPI